MNKSEYVESIVLLSKLHTKQNIEVGLEMSELDLTAAESKATCEKNKKRKCQAVKLYKRKRKCVKRRIETLPNDLKLNS